MAHYTKLRIYADAYDLVKLILPRINRISRAYKFTIGDKVKESSVGMLCLINMINTARDPRERLRYMDEFERQFESVKVCLRLCVDLRLLSPRDLSASYPLIRSVGEQLVRWRKFTEAGNGVTLASRAAAGDGFGRVDHAPPFGKSAK